MSWQEFQKAMTPKYQGFYLSQKAMPASFLLPLCAQKCSVLDPLRVRILFFFVDLHPASECGSGSGSSHLKN
jgi:hypothetical protein